VLDLYARRFDDTPLRPDEYVISADEKTSIQARIRKHATTPAAPSRPARVEAEYFRGGSLAYLAAYPPVRSFGTEPYAAASDDARERAEIAEVLSTSLHIIRYRIVCS
jgi:hypothetical protein